MLSGEAKLLQHMDTLDAIRSQDRGAAGGECCPRAKGERHRAVPALGLKLPFFLPGGV